MKSGWEIVMVMGTLFFAIGALTPGKWSLDYVLFENDVFYLNGYAPILISAVLGIGAGVLLLVTCYRPSSVESSS